jgi:transcriptional regulator with PAS, ATPase and Fis domain
MGGARELPHRSHSSGSDERRGPEARAMTAREGRARLHEVPKAIGAEELRRVAGAADEPDVVAELRQIAASGLQPSPTPAPVRTPPGGGGGGGAGGVADPAGEDPSTVEENVQRRALMARLVRVAREIAHVAGPAELAAALPELALLVAPGSAAALMRVRADGAVELLAQAGPAFQAARSRLDGDARAAAAEPRAPADCACEVVVARSSWRHGRSAAIVLAPEASDTVLTLERPAGAPPLTRAELEHLVVYAALAGTTLARARAQAALQESAARDAATLGAIRDGVIAVDADGVVRALNQAAAAALGVRRDDVLGRRLREVPGMSPLALALAGAPNQVMDVVPLSRGEVVLRSQSYEGGVVATLRDVATEHTIAHRMVGSVARYTFDHLVGQDPAFVRVVEEGKQAARSDVPVLVVGESGTGKELLAQAIHNASPRASGPFLGINVTAIPRELLESELFGYEGGSFTGARTTGRAGKFELAGKGTLLLDEIGDMPLEMQAKLLRVLQERVVQRLGSARDIPVRARIIATTHRDLAEEVAAGRFRLDLFHRLCVVRLPLPALRERARDVPLLVEHQLRIHQQRTHKRVRCSPQLMEKLVAYDWPGNVRQLANVIEGELSVLPPGEDALTRLPSSLQQPAPKGRSQREAARAPGQVLTLEEVERRACEESLAAFHGNVARAAKALGVAKGTLYAKMKRYGLAAPEDEA